MNAFKKAWDAFTTILVVIIVLFALALVGARFAGLKVFTVLSGSMEPAYHTGSLIYVKEVDYTTLKEGDVITFAISEDMVATHRIVGIVPDDEDPSVLRSPVFNIPYMGYVVNYIQHPPGTYVSIAAGAIILLLAFLPDLFADEEENKPEKQKKLWKKS